MVVVAADDAQMDSRSLGGVEELFENQIENGLHPGAAMAVYRHGKLVLDLYGGVAHVESGRPVERDTLYAVYSCSKPLASACVYILLERGKLDLEDPVAKFWPEFARNGKAGVTVRHMLTHHGGFPDTPAELTWDKWRDWDTVVQAMEEAKAIYEPGTTLAYHSLNFGWVVGELVRRVDGRPFRRFLQEELTGPLGMADTYVGLPTSLEGRVAEVHRMEDAPGPQGFAMTFNRPEVHQAVIPAAGGIATARDLARFYAMMVGGGTLDGVQIVNPETIAQVTRLQVQGISPHSGNYSRLSLGLALGHPSMGLSGTANNHTFGHTGAGTSVGWGDLDSGLAVAIVTNGFRPEPSNSPRLAAFSQAVRSACL